MALDKPSPPAHALSANSLAFLEDAPAAPTLDAVDEEISLAADSAPPLPPLAAALPSDEDDGFFPPPAAAATDAAADDGEIVLAADTMPPLPSPSATANVRSPSSPDEDDGFVPGATTDESFMAGYNSTPPGTSTPSGGMDFLADYDQGAHTALDDDGFIGESVAHAAVAAGLAQAATTASTPLAGFGRSI